MAASVKIMLSYDYCHFEICLGDDTIDCFDINTTNALRKKAQRLCDEAVRQYQVAKERAQMRLKMPGERRRYLEEVDRIEKLPEGERTMNEIAMLKAYQDDEWESQFDYSYDYDDDWAADWRE